MRRAALALLARVEAGRGFAAELLRPTDPPFVRELVLGVLRRRLTLDAIHGAFASRPLATLDDEALQAVRVGLYQLFFLDGVPPHAAVAESVGALRHAGLRSYVNAVLRSVLRESHKVHPDEDRGGAHPSKRLLRPGRAVVFFSRPVFPDPQVDPVGYLAALHSHPELLVRRWLAAAGEAETVARLEQGNVSPPVVLRPRAGRADAPGLVEALAAERIPARLLAREHGPAAVELGPKAKAVFASNAWRSGLCSVQAADQMDAVELLAPQPGETIWDACAAPGGKSAQIAELLGGLGRLVATDKDPERLTRLPESIARLGLLGVEVATHDLLAGAAPPGKPAAGFDAILLDAPCSNTAVLAARPEARWRLGEGTFAELAALQANLLRAASAHLAPGGRLVYSVCTHEPEECAGHGLLATRSPFVWRLVRGAT